MYSFNKRIIALLKYIVLRSEYEMFELFIGLILFISSLLILNPYSDLFSNGGSYIIVNSLFSEEAFGAILLFISLLSILGIVSAEMHIRKWAMLGQTGTWTLIFALFVSSPGSVWFPSLLFLFSFFSAIIYARIKRDIKDNKPSWIHR